MQDFEGRYGVLLVHTISDSTAQLQIAVNVSHALCLCQGSQVQATGSVA